MNLPRHATIYLAAICVLTLLQVALGANLIVLAAIDTVCLAGLHPLTRRTFGACDLIYLSFCLYYGTFSLILKTLVLQPVQMNLETPLLTSAYLLAGFGMITLGHALVAHTMTRFYPGTALRTWTLFERTYADPGFQARMTLPFTAISLLFVTVVAMNSHSIQEVATGLADSGGLASLSSLNPVLQLALAMQMSLLATRNLAIDRIMVGVVFAVALALSILNDQKLLLFQIISTGVLHAVAYRIRLRPRFVIIGAMAAALAFLYVGPLIHIVRDLQVEKTDRVSETLHVLDETHYNPVDLLALQASMDDVANGHSLAADTNYLAPASTFSDRFMMLMPIDLMARADRREPMGIMAFVNETIDTVLPSFLGGKHDQAMVSDQMAWRYGIREVNVIARPTLGLLGTGYGVAGIWGLLLLGPGIALATFAVTRLVSNGSLWSNPWAVFIASDAIFTGEADITQFSSLIRTFAPLVAIAWGLIKFDHYLARSASTQRPASP